MGPTDRTEKQLFGLSILSALPIFGRKTGEVLCTAPPLVEPLAPGTQQPPGQVEKRDEKDDSTHGSQDRIWDASPEISGIDGFSLAKASSFFSALRASS